MVTDTGRRFHTAIAAPNFGFFGLEILRRLAAHQDVLPVERPRFGAPLLLEVERAFVRRRTAEIEHAQTGRDRRAR